MSVAIISSSLREGSFSKIMALKAADYLKGKGADVRFVDLSRKELPLCDGGAVYGEASVQDAMAELEGVERLLVATPVYNYSVNSALKNYLELTGRAAWENKIVGFLCAAGGPSSYMAIMPFANSLMLDFRCLIVPRFVYAQGDDFKDGTLADDKIAERIAGLCDMLLSVRID